MASARKPARDYIYCHITGHVCPERPLWRDLFGEAAAAVAGIAAVGVDYYLSSGQAGVPDGPPITNLPSGL
jgi:hypothetical protein